MPPSDEHLFPQINTARYGAARRKRPLFLPNLLKDRSTDRRLEGPARDKAHEIICKWADLESSGKLRKEKETSLEAEFLTQVFGEALDYTLFSDGLDHWNLKPKFSVNGGEADAAIGLFQSARPAVPRAVIELKGPTANLDRDKSNGRTPVQQCWDYLNALPDCPWGIVSNIVSFRLYHRNQTPKIYELFTLQDLRREDEFLRFYYIFQKNGLLPAAPGQTPRADQLLEQAANRQKQVGDDLYDYYHDNRIRLIRHLTSPPRNKTLDQAIPVAQKLIDRIIFVAFCEDRGLLPDRSIFKAWDRLPPFSRVTNPRWRNFLDLFHSIDKGSPDGQIPPYNGGLFRPDPDVDDLDLEDDWTDFFKSIGAYDFQHEINVDILGHLFEKSINDIEKIRLAGLWLTKDEPEPAPKMPKSAERKRAGIYYTPPEFTEFIVNNTLAKLAEDKIDAVAQKYAINIDDILISRRNGNIAKFALEAFEALREIKVLDPACGSGAFLIQAYDALENKYLDLAEALALTDPRRAQELKDAIPDYILHDNLFGVDLSPEAVEITQLALWLRSANKGKSLADLSANIVCGNSLVSDPQVNPRAMDWRDTFPQIFSRETPGFDCVVGNPPWERMKLQEREFFDTVCPEIASAPSAAKRRALIAQLEKTNPDLYSRYTAAKKAAETALAHVRASGRFPLTAKGDINTYALFAELARSLVAPAGRVGILVPSGIATEKTTKDFFQELVDSNSISALYDFENKAPIFPDVHRSYKFCMLLFGGTARESQTADFVFFAHRMEELRDNRRHITLSPQDINLLNPNTKTCPVFYTQRDADLAKAIYKRVPVLVDKNRKEGGNPWEIKFFRMFDQTNDAELFHTPERLEALDFKCSGNVWRKRKERFLPLYEAKMFRQYDHRFGAVYIKKENWINQGQTVETSLVEHQNPEFSVLPRWWASESIILERTISPAPPVLLAFRNVTRATDTRTVIASFIPLAGVINSAPLILCPPRISPSLQCCLLGNLNALPLDYIAKRKIANINLNFFFVEQFPMFAPDFYQQKCPWSPRTTLEKWISNRVLNLTCTANDMIPLAEACGFDPPVRRWDPAERADLMAQLDAAYFILYEIPRDDVEYILSTFAGIRKQREGAFAGSTTHDKILHHYDALNAKSK
ncbi:MAG: N-6 DNA methylase [Sedimentisphaerales bacterium]|nr:N-6 DNA methylase [Sedimentisphaerales bacterium]